MKLSAYMCPPALDDQRGLMALLDNFELSQRLTKI
jgi:hypothetical protein